MIRKKLLVLVLAMLLSLGLLVPATGLQAQENDVSLWAWGFNSHGQLGDGTEEKKYVPTKIMEGNNDWAAIAAGRSHSLAIDDEGYLWAWGNNFYYQLGDGTDENKNVPTKIMEEKNDWAAIAAGDNNSLAIDDEGYLWAWGRFFGSFDKEATPQISINIIDYPTKVMEEKNDWVAIASANLHHLAIDESGHLWSWGKNSRGELGLGDDDPENYKTEPTKVGDKSDWVAIAAASTEVNDHSLAIDAEGELWVWGGNWKGALGLGEDEVSQDCPVPTKLEVNTYFKTVAAGGNSSFAIDEDGHLWAWGDNFKGKLGDGTNEDKYVPTKIGDKTDWVAVDSGRNHTIVLDESGNLWGMGTNLNGQLGIGDDVDESFVPTLIGAETNWIAVAAGMSHTLGLGFPAFEEPEEPCERQKQGYWKDWLEENEYEDCPYGFTGEELLDMLNTPVRGDPNVILSYQFIAAALNVNVNGCELPEGTGCDGNNVLAAFLAAAEHLLSETEATRDNRQKILGWKDILETWNKGYNPGFYLWERHDDADPYSGLCAERSSASFEDNGDGTGTLTIYLFDMYGCPVIENAATGDPLPNNTFRANSDSKSGDHFLYVGGRHFNESGFENPEYPGFSSSNAVQVEDGVYELELSSVCAYDQIWEIGIGSWLQRSQVIVIDTVNINIACPNAGDVYSTYEHTDDFSAVFERHGDRVEYDASYSISLTTKNGDPYEATVTVEGPFGEDIDLTIEKLAFDHFFGHDDQLNMAGTLTYKGVPYYFIFSYTDSKLTLIASEECYEYIWEQEEWYALSEIEFSITNPIENGQYFPLFWHGCCN